MDKLQRSVPLLRHRYQRHGDEAAPGADVGKRTLGLPLPKGAGTGPVAEANRPGRPRRGCIPPRLSTIQAPQQRRMAV
jgi:hypothetical protein